MPRPRKCCYIAQPPAVAGMRPVGGDSVAPEAVTLRYDEYEAIRLIDHQGLTQAAAAERMGISRPTCTRLYDRARRTLAAALVEGRPLRIEGGKVCHSERWYRCPHCRRIHTGTPRCPACRRNEDSEILGQPNTTYNPVNTVIMEKIALPTRNGAVDDHFGHCECYTIFTLDADRRIAGRQTLPAAEGCGCKSDIAPRLHAMGVDVMLAGNMGDGAKNVLQRNGIAVIRGCHGPVEEVVAASLAGRLADSGDACARHHEGGCPEHHGTTGWHLAE